MVDELTDGGLGKAELHEMGLVFPKEMEYAEWEQIGSHLQLMSKAMPWWVGDWLNFGELKYGETYAQAVATTGKEAQTLMNWKSVAKRVPLEMRVPGVSWSQHAEIAALPPEEQAKWLQLSAENDWTREELRKAMKQLPPTEVEGTAELLDDVPFDDETVEPTGDTPLLRIYNLLDAATREDRLMTARSIVLQAMDILDGLLAEEGN